MKIRQTLADAVLYTIKVWPYGLALAVSFALPFLLLTSTNLLVLCLVPLFSLLTIVLTVIFLRALFFAMDEKPLTAASIGQGLSGPVWRYLGLTLIAGMGIGLVIAAVFFVLFLAAMGLGLYSSGEMGANLEALSLAIVVGAALLFLPVLLVINLYIPFIVSSIVDANTSVGDSIREAHRIVKKHWLKILGWVVAIFVVSAVLGSIPQAVTKAPYEETGVLVMSSILTALLSVYANAIWAVLYRRFAQPKPV